MTDPCATCAFGPAHGIDCTDCLDDYGASAGPALVPTSHATPSNARFLFSRVAGLYHRSPLASACGVGTPNAGTAGVEVRRAFGDAARAVVGALAVATALVALQCLGGLP